MKLFDNIKEFFLADEEDDDQADMPNVRHERNTYNRDADIDEPVNQDGGRRNKVVNIQTTAQLQVVLVKPERFEDAPGIADHLCAKKTVVLNLESANKDSAKRLIDFLSGVAYANKGQIKRVANSTFIITPSNVDVTGDLVLEELENGTMYL